MNLRMIARDIDAHLKRFEADPDINTTMPGVMVRRFYLAGAYPAGRYVAVRYVSFQGSSKLTKEQALQYLDWLNAGNVGKHYEVKNAA